MSEAAGTVVVESVEAALEELKSLSPEEVAPKPGPVHVGALAALVDTQWMPRVACHYRAAFLGDVQSFPYFAG